VDTIKRAGSGGLVAEHLRREALFAAQTPQGFRFGPLLAAHLEADRQAKAVDEPGSTEPGWREPSWHEPTDDAELYARSGGAVAIVEGSVDNRKVTYPSDLSKQEAAMLRIGQGYDIHRLVPGRPLMLGGIAIPFELGEDGHSDGDALVHAVIDALFGALGLGDIGTHFPPSDPRWKGAASLDLLELSLDLVRRGGGRLVNLDSTVTLERPKLAPHIQAIRESLAWALGIDPALVSVKAKTKEGVDATGEGRAVEANAVCLVEIEHA
jgi:2-C-methyl-D-erythritol 4-phosphate cytidylyltransferase / 2-C-methyl-D-erythritol 2,4-cyclodiphosphate synthase